MMFDAMVFKFCPIHIKHQTFNFKLKKGAVALSVFYLMRQLLFYNNVFTASEIFFAMYGLFMV